MDKAVWQEESAYLQTVVKALREELREIDRRFEKGITAADEAAEESVRQLLEGRFRALKRTEGTPYFARIDFFANTAKRPETEKIYIGKTSVYDGGSGLLVTDWRAPVSSLYYDSRLGEARYESPGGAVEGELRLKRRFTVEDARLKDFDDIDVTATDELLAPYLSVSADIRLKNIVATIQAGQNAVIRAAANRPLIVQGAAGSGKSTVALHRIAYLAYNMGARFRPEQFLLLSSGGFFLSYIAGVLPDLGVEDVPQRSFEDLVRGIVKAKFQIIDPTESGGGDAPRRMSGLGNDNEEPQYPLSGGDAPRRMSASAGGNEEVRYPLSGGDAPQRMSASAGGNEEVRYPLSGGDAYKNSYEILSDIDAYLATDTATGVKRHNALAVYKGFLEQSGRYIVKNRLYMEDLAPLLYIKIRVSGLSEAKVRHVVIDEAQDFTPMQLTVLQTLYRKASFTILGDLAQSIYGAPEDWESVNRQVWQGSANVLTLQKSYRATVEIIGFANRVLEGLAGIPKAEPVVRRGEPVACTDVWGEDDRAAACTRLIKERAALGHKNIAVILSRPPLCHGFARLMKTPALRVITSRDGQYEGGVCLLPAALSKGLEFDSVIVADADRYEKDALGRKLLYVAMTRAMHTLDILYEGENPMPD